MPTSLPASILFRPGGRPGDGAETPAEAAGSTPPFAADLHLDEIAAALAGERREPLVAARFYGRLRDPDAVTFRHEVFRDLRSAALREKLTAFVARMRVVDEHLAHAAAIAHPPERQRWQLEAADSYVAAVVAVTDALGAASLGSRGLAAVAGGLRAYVDSKAFATLGAETARMLGDLAGVTYRLRIDESRIVVERHDGEADYGAEVLATFARFRRSETPAPVPVDVFRTVDMNVVEVGVLERVARLHPAVFSALEAYGVRHAAFIDPGVATFADELTFYLAWLELIAPLEAAGLSFCEPEVSKSGGGLHARGLFDLALARRRVPSGEAIVGNDIELSGTERLLVITGPNQGGKTALARAIGQLHHLAAIGVTVPGTAARVGIGDAVHTLFARAEDPGDLTGRLEAELTRARTILDALRPGSLAIMNESFASTTAEDALALDRALIGEMTTRGAMCVVVTFLGELAADDASVVSLTGVLDPLDPTRPTYRFERRPADPLAQARAVADVHGLGYDAVRDRIARGAAGAVRGGVTP